MFAEVAPRLAERGNDVTLLCSSAGKIGTDIENGIRVVRDSRRGTILRAPVAWLASRVASDADIVHVPATYPFTTQSVLRRAKRLNVPSVLDFHFEPAPGSWLGQVASRAYAMTVPRAYELARAVLVRSLAYGRSAPSLNVLPESRWRVIPNGIDPTVFFPVGDFGSEPYLLFVGRLVPYKGLHVLLAALARIKNPPPLYIVGDGPLRSSLEAEAQRRQVDVRFLGRVDDQALPRLYRNAQLTLLPSVNGQEAFGISLLESMACGTPVVASALPGVSELAQTSGLLARPGDAASLAHQIKRALVPGTLQRGPELARRVHSAYSWDAVADRLVAVYHEVSRTPDSAASELTESRGQIACEF